MRLVFADTFFWVALANPLDQWHVAAVQASSSLRGAMIVTSEEVLTEFLAYFSNQGRQARETATRYADRILADPGVVVRPQSHQTFVVLLYRALDVA